MILKDLANFTVLGGYPVRNSRAGGGIASGSSPVAQTRLDSASRVDRKLRLYQISMSSVRKWHLMLLPISTVDFHVFLLSVSR